jgi:hypothetical protein
MPRENGSPALRISLSANDSDHLDTMLLARLKAPFDPGVAAHTTLFE